MTQSRSVSDAQLRILGLVILKGHASRPLPEAQTGVIQSVMIDIS